MFSTLKHLINSSIAKQDEKTRSVTVDWLEHGRIVITVAKGYAGLFPDEYLKRYQEHIRAFAEFFPIYCKLHNIPLLKPGHAAVELKILEGGEKLECYFNVSAESFYDLQMKICPGTVAYRNLGGILTLAFPLKKPVKKGVICIAPVAETYTEDTTTSKLEVSKVEFMIRTAGCNSFNMISTQLAYHLSHYFEPESVRAKFSGHLPTPDSENDISQFHGHEQAPLVYKYLPALTPEIFGTFTYRYLCSENYYFDPSLERLCGRGDITGEEIFKFKEPERYIFPIVEDSEAYNVYRVLGVVPKEELLNCRSLEIPLGEFLLEAEKFIRNLIIKYPRIFSTEDLDKTFTNMHRLAELANLPKVVGFWANKEEVFVPAEKARELKL